MNTLKVYKNNFIQSFNHGIERAGTFVRNHKKEVLAGTVLLTGIVAAYIFRNELNGSRTTPPEEPKEIPTQCIDLIRDMNFYKRENTQCSESEFDDLSESFEKGLNRDFKYHETCSDSFIDYWIFCQTSGHLQPIYEAQTCSQKVKMAAQIALDKIRNVANKDFMDVKCHTQLQTFAVCFDYLKESLQ